MPVEQHPEFVDPVGDVVDVEDDPVLRRPAAEQFVPRHHRVVGRVVRVVDRRPVHDVPGVVGRGEEVRDRHGLVVRHAEAVLWPRRRAPRADLRRGARLGEEDARRGGVVVPVGVGGHPPFVCSPAQLGRLQALGQEAVHRPGVDEGADGPGRARVLRIPLGDVDARDTHLAHERGPLRTRRRHGVRDADGVGDVEQRLLDEPGHHAGVGAARGHRRSAAGPGSTLRQKRLAQCVIRALRHREPRIVVQSGPRLDHRVDVQRPPLAGQSHDVHRRGVHGEIHHKRARRQQRVEHLGVGLLREERVDADDAGLLEHGVVVVVRRQHGDPRRIDVEVAQDEWKRAAADRAEADHDDVVKASVGLHRSSPFGESRSMPVGGRW